MLLNVCVAKIRIKNSLGVVYMQKKKKKSFLFLCTGKYKQKKTPAFPLDILCMLLISSDKLTALSLPQAMFTSSLLDLTWWVDRTPKSPEAYIGLCCQLALNFVSRMRKQQCFVILYQEFIKLELSQVSESIRGQIIFWNNTNTTRPGVSFAVLCVKWYCLHGCIFNRSFMQDKLSFGITY